MPKKRILIFGNVHDVGYKPFLLKVAGLFDIKRFYADNLIISDKKAVEVLIDDEEDKVSLFIEYIKRHKPENADVEKIEIEDYDGYVCSIDSYYKYLTALQLEKIATYGGLMLKLQKLTLEELEKINENLNTRIDDIEEKLLKLEKSIIKRRNRHLR